MIQTAFRTRLSSKALLFFAFTLLLFSCKEQAQQTQQPPLVVDFIQLGATNAEVEKKYPGTIEGTVNVDIKAQVTGYLEQIYVKEGDYVKKGQPLFKIKGDVYNEQVNNSKASLEAALAAQATAKLEVEKLKPLVAGKVVSDMQLKTAQSNYEAATAQVQQAKAGLSSSKINLDFSVLKAPVSGYIGRIPNRIGNLVMPNDATPLTTLSEINEVLVYFSLSEADYISFAKEGGLQKNANSVELVMADGSVYNHKGRLTVASGNIDKMTGSMSFKAIFPNPQKLLRSGGTARVILKKDFDGVLKVPMGSVKDIQDKYFVFTLGDSSKVAMKPFEVAGKVDGQYIVKSGLKAGEKIATNNIDMLNEGVVVKAVIK